MELRPYQTPCIERTRELLREGAKRILLVLPTGAGKGTMSTYMIQGIVSRGKKAMFLVNRRELVKDMSRRLDRLGLDHGVIMGDHPRHKPWLPVQVASIDTIHRRSRAPAADILFVDEAHFAVSESWESVLGKYPNTPTIGMTATPIRADGKGLGRIFTHMVVGPTMRELIELGFLVPTRVFAPSTPNLKGVAKTAGDWNQKQLGIAMDKPGLTGDIVAHWLKHARGLPTVGFAVNIEHSNHIVAQFTAAGVRACHVDANTPSDERDRTWDALEAGRFEVVMSVGIISYGWDVPPVRCAILARPTNSEGLYLQQVGRIVRSHPGKDLAIVLDHAGNTALHGFVDDEREWSLEDGCVKKKSASEDVVAVRMCRTCWCAFAAPADKCPACGAPWVSQKRKVNVKEGELVEVRAERWYKCHGCDHRGRLPDGATYEDFACARCQTGPLVPLGSKYDSGQDDADRKDAYLKLLSEARQRNYKDGWAPMQFKIRFGKWPPREWKQEAERAMTFSF